jgi:hypothetical protein
MLHARLESDVSDFRRKLIFVRLVGGQVLFLLLLYYIRRRVFLRCTIVKLLFDGTSFYPLIRIMFCPLLNSKKEDTCNLFWSEAQFILYITLKASELFVLISICKTVIFVSVSLFSLNGKGTCRQIKSIIFDSPPTFFVRKTKSWRKALRLQNERVVPAGSTKYCFVACRPTG